MSERDKQSSITDQVGKMEKQKLFLTIFSSTFFRRRFRSGKLLLPLLPLFRRRLGFGFGQFWSRLLALGGRGRRGCQAQQRFHLNTPTQAEQQQSHEVVRLRFRENKKQPSMHQRSSARVPERVHGLAARLPTAHSHVLPFVHCVQELHIHPLVHGLGVAEVAKILQ